MNTYLFNRHTIWTIFVSLLVVIGLGACSDVSNAPAPPPQELAIATGSLPSGSPGIFYDVTLAPSGGAPPYSWALFSGALPDGLTLASSGRISGIPPTAQTTTPTFILQDSAVPTPTVVTKQLSIAINPIRPPSISAPPSLPNGIVGLSYSATLTVTQGTPPYTKWTVEPPLPLGLTFTPAGNTATITGSPQPGTATITSHTFSVTDSFSPTPLTGSKPYSLTISNTPLPLLIVTNSLPPGTVSTPYPTQTLGASGGTPPYTWSIVGGLAPAPGLALTPNGVNTGQITGTPNSNVGSPFTQTYQVQDSAVPPVITKKVLQITISLPSP